MRIAIAVVLSFLLMLISLGTTGPLDLFSFLNADTMYFYSMYHDLFAEGNPLAGWDLNTTFNLVPNALLYLPAYFFGSHPVLSQIIHGLLQYGLFLWAAWYMLHSLKPGMTKSALALAMLLPSWFFLNAMHSGNFFLAAQFFHPYHFGALIMTCFLVGLNIRQLREASAGRKVWIVVLVALASFSNRIFLMMFVVPWLLTLGMGWILSAAASRRPLLLNGLLNGAGMVAGLLLFFGVKNIEGLSFQPTRMFSWDNVGPSFQALVRTYTDFLVKSPLLGALMVISLVLLTAVLVVVLRQVRTIRTKEGVMVPRFYFMVFTLFFVPVVFLAPALNGMFFSMASARYNFMVIIWMMLAAAPLMQVVWKGNPRQAALQGALFSGLALTTVAAALLLSSGRSPMQGLRELAGHYPHEAQCIDQAARTHGLKNGLAAYWSAKPVTLFSHEGIRVRQVYHNLRPYFLGASRNWYFPFDEKAPVPVFNFILHDNSLDPQVIHEVFGTRIDTLVFEECVIYRVPRFSFREDKTIMILE